MATLSPLVSGSGVMLRQPERSARAEYRGVMLWLAFACIMTTSIVLSISGLNFPLERIYGLALIPAMIYRLLSPGNLAIKKLLLLWAAWCGILFVSALASGDFPSHLAPWLIAVVPVSYFSFITAKRIDGVVIDRIVRVLLWIFGALGTITLAASRVIGPEHVPFRLIDSYGRLRLTVIEPNLLGSTFGFLIVLSLARARLTSSTVAMYLMASITILGALSKGPLIAVILAIALFGIFRSIARRENLSFAVITPIWLISIGGIALLLLLPYALDTYNTLLARQDAIFSRTYVLRLAMARFWESPLIGRGPGDFGLLDPNLLRAIGGQGDAHNLWIAQMVINILHDSGVVGLVVYIIFLVLVLRRGYKWVRAGSVDHAGYLAAFLSVVIASQTSTVHLNAIFGIAAGLVASMPSLQITTAHVNCTGAAKKLKHRSYL